MNDRAVTIDDILMLANEIGQAYRGDWNDFDGRTLRMQMNELTQVANGSMTIEQYRAGNELCPRGDGHWIEYCDMHHDEDDV